MIKLGKRIATLREAKNWTQKQLAEACGWEGQSRIGNYERDVREPSLADMERIASALGYSVKELLFGDAEAPSAVGRVIEYQNETQLSQGDYVMIDRYDLKLSAGCGTVAWVIHEKNPIAFRQQFMRGRKLDPANLKALYVKGDSMQPYLTDNDTVMIDITDTTPEDGEVYAVCYDDEWYIKRIFKVPGGLVLHSDNPKYRDIEVTGERAAMVTIFGRVVWRGG